jgi:hypothetical protein
MSRYDYEDFEKFSADRQLELYDEFFDEFREFEPCPFENFDEWLKKNNLETKFNDWSWNKFEVYRQNADESIWGEDR